jgi:hypothetical protein
VLGLDKYGYKVTYRIKQEDKLEYKAIKDFVTEELHSDICFFNWTALKALYQAFKNAPNAESIEVKFLRQNVQINMGCTINYNRLKARRLPPKEPALDLNKNYFLPLLLEEWPTMNEKSKEFWRAELKRIGVIQDTHPLISTGKPKKQNSFFETLHSIVQQLLAKLFGCLKRRKT